MVGNTGTAGGATLYQVPISQSALTGASNPVATGLNSTEYPFPSPATEFCNGACTSNGTETTAGTDYVFFSVNRGAKTGCTNAAGNGCVLSYNINNPSRGLPGRNRLECCGSRNQRLLGDRRHNNR